MCNYNIEDEKHDILSCPLYAYLRFCLYSEAMKYNVDFNDCLMMINLYILFRNINCYDMVAKTCFDILSGRNTFLYS